MTASPDRPVPYGEHPDRGSDPGAPGPDLDDLRAMWERLDPVPAGLADRVLFALEVEELALDDLDLELMRLVQEDAGAHATRGDDVRTITFGSDSMTVMLALTEVEGGFRVDGWVAPGGVRDVEVRTGGGSSRTVCDSTGRFSVPLVPPGHFQLVLDAGAGATPGAGGPDGEAPVPPARRAVVTPALTL